MLGGVKLFKAKTCVSTNINIMHPFLKKSQTIYNNFMFALMYKHNNKTSMSNPLPRYENF